MAHKIPFKEKAIISIGAILWFVLVLFFLLSWPIVLGASVWAIVACIALAALLSIPLFFSVKHIVKKRGHDLTNSTYLKMLVATSMLLVCLLAFPILYLAYITEADPLVMPKVHLSNGQKQVVFQGMIHVGSENFYKSIVYDLEKALVNGYDLFYEGVQPADEEANQWFSNALAGGKDLSENYKAMADVCGIKFQLDYFTPLAKQSELDPAHHVTADVSTRDMLNEWQRLTAANPGLDIALDASKSKDDNPGMMFWLQEQNEERKKLAGVVCRAFITRTISKPKEAETLSPVVLDFRNLKLAEKIIQHEHDKIYITYGAAHMPGVIEELKRRDPNWEVESIKWVRAMHLEQEYQGDPGLVLKDETR